MRPARERAESRALFRKAARTFSLAALFFDRATYAGACQVYAWCRHCDDAIDECTQERGQLEARLDELRTLTRAVFHGEVPEGPFREFQRTVERHGIPEQLALDLLEGLAMDARRETYETLAELELYAYRVAGTVGLMMAHVMGVSDLRAYHHAKQLGIAMQLTNISRDVLADAELGRVYLPLSWLREGGVDSLKDPAQRPALAQVTHRLVRDAEAYYREGEAGLRFLSFRHAVAIAAASRIYRAIGWYVVRRGRFAWDSRTVVPRWRKLWELTLAPLRARSWV